MTDAKRWGKARIKARSDPSPHSVLTICLHLLPTCILDSVFYSSSAHSQSQTLPLSKNILTLTSCFTWYINYLSLSDRLPPDFMAFTFAQPLWSGIQVWLHWVPLAQGLWQGCKLNWQLDYTLIWRLEWEDHPLPSSLTQSWGRIQSLRGS